MLTAEGKRKVERTFSFNAGIAKNFFRMNSVPKYFAPELGCVYAFEMSDNTVKLGVTTNTEKRIKSVQCAVYLKVLRVHQTALAPLDFMRIIEARCHATFMNRRVRGEYFDITFEEAVAELERYADEIAAKFAEADQNFLDEYLYYEELTEKYFTHNTPASTPATAAKPAPNPKRREEQIRAAFVYVLLMSDGTVKIGHSSNVITRTSKIERERKLKATQVYFTFLMSREDARLIEWAFKKNFSSRRVEGEFFSVTFAEACAAVDLLAKNILVSSIREHLTYKTKISIADKKLD